MQIDSRLRFDNYIIGSGNRMAVAAARAVADAPGQVYNPLFVYSASGLGKTHLLMAIANGVAQRHRAMTIEALTLDELVDALQAAVTEGKAAEMRQRFSRVGLLLVDDIQFLTGHRETQNELLRIIIAMQAAQAQIVMTSDRPPAEIADVDERLLSRMSGGLIADIAPPDYETRAAIIREKVEERGVRFRSGVVEELARADVRSIRELEGALNRLVAAQTLGGQQLRPEDVARLLGEQRSSGSFRRATVEMESWTTAVESALDERVEAWRTQLAEAISYWSGEGYNTRILDAALQSPTTPPVEQLLRDFEQSVAKLRSLAAAAREIDPIAAAHDAFRDPERVAEAEAVFERVRRAAAPLPAPSASFARSEFATSTTNQLAVRAADVVASEPGTRYNPLFIHGPSGVGKTHLLNAIGNQLMQSGTAETRRHVACLPAHTFVDELIGALQDGSVDRWRARYRRADALLLDDVQFVAGKERTQEELFHVFNALHAAGKQLVFVSDRPPAELQDLADRLRSRFEGGLVVRIERPDPPLRETLYERYLRAHALTAVPELVQYLAQHPVKSAREILGVVNRLVSAAEVAGTPLTLEFVRQQLETSEPQVVAAATSAPADARTAWDWQDVRDRVIEDLV